MLRRDAGFAAVDVLRRSLHAVDADGVELPTLNGAVEARSNLRRDVHFEKTLADGADPIIQAPFRLDQTGRPRLDDCRRPGCHDPPSAIDVDHRLPSLLGVRRRVQSVCGVAVLPGGLQPQAAIFCSNAINASGAVTFGEWLASIS